MSVRNIFPKIPVVRALVRFHTAGAGRPFPDVPSCNYYDELIHEAGSSRDFETLRRLLNNRNRDGFFNTTRTFSFITNTESSLSVLEDLIKTLAQVDKGFPRKNAFDSLISRLCKLGLIDESFRVVDAMVSGDCGINAVTFHPMLSALTRKKKIEEAWRVMELAREVGVSPDKKMYNYLLTAYCYGGNLAEAAGVLTKMRELGLEADSCTFDALVMGACRAGKVEGALEVLRRMEDEGWPVQYSTHVHVIRGLLELGYYAQAVKFVMIYSGKDLQLDTESFGILANRLLKMGRTKEAKVVLAEMGKRGLRMDHKLKDFYEMNVKSEMGGDSSTLS